jgi:hypothetical protein
MLAESLQHQQFSILGCSCDESHIGGTIFFSTWDFRNRVQMPKIVMLVSTSAIFYFGLSGIEFNQNGAI